MVSNFEEFEGWISQKLEEDGYKRTHVNESAFLKLANYTTRWYLSDPLSFDDRDPEPKPDKGLFLFGPTGTGKTAFMKIFSYRFGIPMITADELTRIFILCGEKGVIEYLDEFKYGNLIVDDFGNLDKLKVYGNRMPMELFIFARHKLLEDKGHKTFFTSNLSNRQELATLYGDAVLSRIMGMCEFIKLEGADWRISHNGGTK